MKITKGMSGYIRSQKKKRILITILLFGISIAVFLAGYLTTHTRNNLLTIVAILGCLPAARSAVSMILLLPYRSLEEEKVKAVREAAPGNVLVFDLVLTSSEKIMAVDALLVSKHLLCGYVAQTKAPVSEIEAYLAKILRDNHYEKVTVKLFSDYDAFYKRVGACKRGATSGKRHVQADFNSRDIGEADADDQHRKKRRRAESGQIFDQVVTFGA